MSKKHVYIGVVTILGLLLAAHFIMPISEDFADKNLISLNADDGPAVSAPLPDGTLGEFATRYGAYPKNRGSNIQLASDQIDGVIVLPGQVFSFNDAVGPTTKANGFKLARTFIKGKDTRGYGGGVCQVSTTLYNAALMAGMEILERHAHSKPVGYVAEDRDAATSYGSMDFKFRNNLPYPVRVNSAVENVEKKNQIKISITKV